jgi:hypothetical protein
MRQLIDRRCRSDIVRGISCQHFAIGGHTLYSTHFRVFCRAALSPVVHSVRIDRYRFKLQARIGRFLPITRTRQGTIAVAVPIGQGRADCDAHPGRRHDLISIPSVGRCGRIVSKGTEECFIGNRQRSWPWLIVFGESKRTGVGAKNAASSLMRPSKSGEYFTFTKETIHEAKH